MSDARNFSDELSFSFRLDKGGLGEENTKKENNDCTLASKFILNISPEDIFCTPVEEKRSFYSYELGLELPEIRFSEKSPELANKEEVKRISEIDIPALEFSFTNELQLNGQNKNDLNALETLFDNHTLSDSGLGNLPNESFSAQFNPHYTLSEDYFLLFKIGEYRSKTPRRISKENFIVCLQPLLGRTPKSISKRIDRLRALSLSQKKRLVMYVRKFPKQALYRKAIFDSKGKSLVIKQLANKPLPLQEQEYINTISRYFSNFAEKLPQQRPSYEFSDESSMRNCFQDHRKEESFSDLYYKENRSFDDAEMGADKENFFWQTFLDHLYQVDYAKLETKVSSLKLYGEKTKYEVKDAESFRYFLDFLSWSFKINVGRVLNADSLGKFKSFNEIKNLFLAALPHRNFRDDYFN